MNKTELIAAAAESAGLTNKDTERVLNAVINLLRSIPFLILMVVVMPLSRLILGTSVGTAATIVPLTVAAAPYVARLVEASLREMDRGVIEAAQSMGCSTWQIVTKVMLPECKPSLINGATNATITILSYGAMSGAIGGGGLGAMSLMRGYARGQTIVLYVAVILLVILVQIIQSVMGVVGQLVTFSTQTVKPIIERAFAFITQTVLPTIVSMFAAAAPTIASIISSIGSAVMTGMQIIGSAIQMVMPIIGAIIEIIMNVGSVTIPAVLAAFSAFAQGISDLMANIQGIFDGLISFITGAFTGNWSKAWDGIKQVFGNAFDALVTLCKTPINAVISLINKAIEGINGLGLDIPDWVPLLGGKKFSIDLPKIPLLGKGGFTSGPSIAGEAGREAVISFKNSERARNISLWEQAGRMLGVNSIQLDELKPEWNEHPGDVGSITYAPQITIQGNADRGVIDEALQEAQARFEAWYEQMMRQRARTAY